MRSKPWKLTAALAAAVTVGLPMISTEHTPRSMIARAGMCLQPETPRPPEPGATPARGDQPPPQDAAARPETAPVQPSPAADEREARITMTDGSVFIGLLGERTKETITLHISGIPTPFPMKDIARVDTLPPNRERYEEYKAAIDPKDVKSRLHLAKWLQSVEMLAEALDQVEQVLTIDDTSIDAKDLKTLIEQQIRLRDRAGSPPGKAAPKNADQKPKVVPFPVLTPEQINQIRVYEINLTDPPRMTVPRDAITKLIEQYAGDPLIPSTREGREGMYRRRPDQILELMYKLRARDLYSLIKVQEDPQSLKQFRDDVNRGWLINYCATTDCHGGTAAGRLWMNNRHPNSDATVYTNFLILDRFRVRATVGDRKGELVPLIDYANAAQSPLLQLALPPTTSLFPHPTPDRPGKAAYRPLFRNEDDVRFKRGVEWIGSMYLPRPDYHIDYTPPEPPKPVAQQPPPEEGEAEGNPKEDR